jgi:hypothetical protein
VDSTEKDVIVQMLLEALEAEHERMLTLWEACIFYARRHAEWDGGMAADEALRSLLGIQGPNAKDMLDFVRQKVTD